MTHVYFPNLNAVRFLAAFGVIVHHVELHKYVLGEPNYWHIPFFDLVGKVCVVLFFVLSGFLITYLLLKERDVTGRIATGPFYMRRVLRIWPLYYLMAALGLFVFPYWSVMYLPTFTAAVHDGFWQKAALLLVILPNLIIFPIPGIYQLWSIGVEEQFYLIWPVLMKRFRPLVACLIVIAGYLLVKFGLYAYLSTLENPSTTLLSIQRIWNKSSIDCMAFGGVTAYLLYTRHAGFLRVVFHPATQVVTYGLTAGLVAYGVVFPYLHFEVYGVLFAVLLVNLAANPRSLVRLENPVFNYLGKISYGLYMFHLVGIALAHWVTRHWAPGEDLLLHGLSVGLTIGLAALSYQYFEKPFIRLKTRFTKVKSGAAPPTTSPAPSAVSVA
jgi:peptidoglycan/LPS O-acetylase OafA/YrhL